MNRIRRFKVIFYDETGLVIKILEIMANSRNAAEISAKEMFPAIKRAFSFYVLKKGEK